MAENPNTNGDSGGSSSGVSGDTISVDIINDGDDVIGGGGADQSSSSSSADHRHDDRDIQQDVNSFCMYLGTINDPPTADQQRYLKISIFEFSRQILTT